MQKNENNKLLIIIFIALVIILLLVYYFKEKNEDKNYYTAPEVVTNNSNFYTVSSCVSKYISYLYSKDVDNLLVLLNQKYIDKFNIDSNNIFDYIQPLSSYQTFKAKKMYFSQVDKHIYKYYVYGVLEEEYIDSIGKYVSDLYVIVYLNEDGMTFSIEPYDGEMFK